MYEGMLILAVDDRPDNLYLLEALIAAELPGCELVTAESAVEGLRMALARPPDAVLIDVQMPGMDGLEMTRQLKADPATADTPILLLTAHEATPDLRARGMDAGADDFVIKPIDNAELLARIRVALRVRRAESRLREYNTQLEAMVASRTAELQASQARLLQAQKLEAVGRLAGGVAHDFNNLLTIVQGNMELLAEELAPGSEAQELAMEIFEASRRGARLTAQLLAFARKGARGEAPLDVHQVISDVASLLTRSIDRLIEIETHLDAPASMVLGDRSLVQSMILNLALNARDAMPEGGVLTLATRASTLPAGSDDGDRPGIEIEVSDTGVGMNSDTVDRCIEPFFTTKEQGKGTGLGLASAYGTAHSLGGTIEVISKLGAGTTLLVHLPITQKTVVQREEPSGWISFPEGGRILVIDDEAAVLQFAARALGNAGFEVTTAPDGVEGTRLFAEQEGNFDLVVLDAIMPRWNGRETYAQLCKIDPNVRVLLSTGYTTDELAASALQDGVSAILPKPYTIEQLLSHVELYLKRQPPE